MGKVDDLKNRLFRREAHFEEREDEPELAPNDTGPAVPHAWQNGGKDTIRDIWEQKRVRRRRMFIWTMVVSLFLILVGGGAAFFFLGTIGGVSSKNVDISIITRETITAGDRVAFEVRFKNNNEVALESTELVFLFPEGAQPLFGDPPKGPFRERRDIGRLQPGEERMERFEAYVMGKAGEERKASASLEYRPTNSSAHFGNDAMVTLRIDKSPLSVAFDVPDEANAGQEIVVRADYVSSGETVFKNISLNVAYPPGFEFIASDPPPSKGTDIWRLGDISPNQTGTISIRGNIKGDAEEGKNFNARIGLYDNDTNTWDVYGDTEKIVQLRAPLLALDAFVNSSKEFVAKAGDMVRITLPWKNNLPVTVTDVIITASVSGRIIDPASIRVESGSYDGASQQIIWNAFSNPALKTVKPGDSGYVAFSVSVPRVLPIFDSNDRNFTASVSGRIFTNVIPQGYEGVDITGKSSVTFKAATNASLVARAYYYSDLLPNSGPLPPRVGEETTYTITWSLSNLSNDIENAVVKSGIPSYAKWKNESNPPSSGITYNANTGEVAWDVGLLQAGTGVVRPAREVSFKIGITPGPNLIGLSPELIAQAVFTGKDTFTGNDIRSSVNRLTTDIRTDPRVSVDQYKVVP